MKRTLSLVLALVMVLGSFSAVFAAPEAVVNEAAELLEREGVLEGDGEDLMLENTLLRRDMVILLSRLMGVEDVAVDFPAEDVLTFEDITDPFYNGYLAWSVSNKLIEGHDEKTFGFNENVTAQQYATVLLRAMGVEFEYETALETAKELGLLADVEVENTTEILRSEMAVITLNALKAEDGKLAEELGIELPEPPTPAALEVEAVYADNLKQVVVEFNQELDEKTATNKDNYTLDLAMESVELLEDGKTVVITLDKNEATVFESQKEYELKIANVENADKAQKFTSTTFKFRPVDVTVPYVKEVVALGTKAIKVVFNEPVKSMPAGSTNSYRIDDKFVAGVAKYVFSNEVIITTNVTVGDHTLSVTGVEDFRGYKVQETGISFTVVEDTDAPEIVKAYSIDLNKAVVEFNEPVKAVAKAYHTAKANNAKVEISGNEVTLTFLDTNKMGLGATTLTLEGVQDYSDNKADRTVVITPELDITRPEIVEVKVEKGKDFTLTFNKELDVETVDKNANFTVKKSDGTVVKGHGLNNDGNPVVPRVYDNAKKTVKFSLVTSLPAGSYLLEVSGIRDKATIANVMVPETHDFEVGDTKALTVNKAWTANIDNGAKDLFIQFNKAVAVEGTGNALEVSKYNIYSGWDSDSTPEKGIGLGVLPNATTIELVAEDTVKLRLAKPAEGVSHPTIAGVRVTRVSDNNKNFIADSDFKVNSTLTVGIKKVEATATDKIEVTFEGQLNAVMSDFTVVGDNYASTVNIVDLSVTEKDGNTVATFTLDSDAKLPEGPVGFNLKTESTAAEISSIDNWNNKLKANESKPVVDKIKPTVATNGIAVNKGAQTITITFNEDLDLVGPSTSVVKVGVVGKKVASITFANGLNAKDLVISVTLEDGEVLEATDVVTIELLEANDTVKTIVDKAENAPAPFERAITVQ